MTRELTEVVDLADTAGRLQAEAIGWSRQPVHRLAFSPGVTRVHAFDYWCVTNDQAALSLVVADVGFAGFALVSVQDLAGGSPTERIYIRPRGLPSPMPAGPDGDLVFEARRLRMHVGPHRLAAAAKTLTGTRIELDLAIERPPGHETINLVVPWSAEQFHFTSKQQALPARGELIVGEQVFRFAPDTNGFACRDFGRGRWPRGVDWCWSFCSTRASGHVLGFNLGASWTDGTGVNENGLVIDGRVHKLDDIIDVDFDRKDPEKPWHIRTRASRRVDLTFTPVTLRKVTVPPLIRLTQCMGRYHGTVVDDAGRTLRIAGALGLSEAFRGRW